LIIFLHVITQISFSVENFMSLDQSQGLLQFTFGFSKNPGENILNQHSENKTEKKE